MFGRDFFSPSLDSGAVDLHSPPADAADQVMVMPTATPAIRCLTVGGSQNVDFSHVGEQLKRAVNRREPDLVTPFAEQVVDLLGSPEVVKVAEQRRDSSALTCGANRWTSARDRHVAPFFELTIRWTAHHGTA